MIAVGGSSLYEKSGKASHKPLIEGYAPLVKRIAQHMITRMPANVQLDDLLQAGMIGLLEATQKYDPSQGASFDTYAGIRIRGSMIDEVRKGDWVPRSVHRNARLINDAMAKVEVREGRDATSSEVAEEMGIHIDEYYAMSQDALCGRLFSVEESIDDDELHGSDSLFEKPDFHPPHHQVHRDHLKQAMVRAINTLPERERLVLSLYYDEELNLKEIGQVLGVSESRVSQMHSQAALRLRTRLHDWL